MDQPNEKIRWSIERRLEFIDFRLYWEGKINRSDLTDFFDISVPQASADISRYQELRQENLAYDGRAKSYLVTPSFRPVRKDPDARHYLAQLRSISDGILSKEETWFGWLPPYEVVPAIVRRVDAQKLQLILKAIRTRSAEHVEYQSLSRPAPLWRWLSPHALAFDGARWHVRAWCHMRENFQDFVLARMLNFGESRPTEIDPARDAQWNEFVVMRIGPHPKLSNAARRAIELDYGMENGELTIRTRVCLSFYLERRFNLDIDPALMRPERMQLILLNRAEVEETRKQTAARSEAIDSAKQ